ncbi:hypothetical protein F4780DRAFT_795360 [Xylariomycetidae sp. FL0641]|nr:hypothetical protein F4780DRAFT_795360 [Xylariomycetidae sp. FL0641]
MSSPEFVAPLAALTTAFTPPCPTSWLLTTTKLPSQYPPFPTFGPSSCDPPAWDTYVAARGWAYYSPAQCPSGFTVGPGCVVTAPRTDEGFPPLTAGETAAYCVPSGQTCTADITDFQGGVWGVQQATGASSNAAAAAAATVAPAIQIRWRAQDVLGGGGALGGTNPLAPPPVEAESTGLAQATASPPTPTIAGAASTTVRAVSSSSSSSSTGSSSSTTAAAASSATAATNGDGNRAATSRLSLAAVVLAALLLALLLGWGNVVLLRRLRSRHRRRRPPAPPPKPPPVQPPGKKMVVVDDDGSSSLHADAELGVVRAELGPGHPLGSRENPAELGGGDRWSWFPRVSRRVFSVRFMQPLQQDREREKLEKLEKLEKQLQGKQLQVEGDV